VTCTDLSEFCAGIQDRNQARVGCRGRTKRIIPALLLAACLVLAAPLAFAPRAAAFVYWTNSKPGSVPKPGAVGRANLNGTGVDHQFIGDAKTVFDVAVDAAHVYWTTGDAIGRANLDGTGVDRSFITGLSSPEGVAVDASHVYWSSYSSSTIGRANLDGTGVNESFITGAGLPEGPTEVAVDAAHV
jgi:streptogramin lyase